MKVEKYYCDSCGRKVGKGNSICMRCLDKLAWKVKSLKTQTPMNKGQNAVDQRGG